MRILYHHRTLGDGAEGIHIREMIKAFRELGHEVRVIGPVGEVGGEPTKRSSVLAGLKRAIPSAAFELMELAYAVYAFFRTSVEIRRFRPHFIYDRYITFNFGTVLAANVNRLGLLLEVNAPLALERSQEKDERLFFKRLARGIESWTCSKATRTVVVSTPLREYLESIGVPTGHCIVMPNGVDPGRFAPNEQKNGELCRQLGLAQESFTVGFTGVLRPWHGLDLLLHAVARLAGQGLNVSLLIVGDGPYRGNLEELVSELGLSKVRVTGRVRHEQVPQYISLFDVAVSPRATFYASPMKVVEYMASGKPVVVPRTANFLDLIDEGVNALAFADGDVAELAAALSALYRSPELRRALGQEARRKVETRLNWKWNASRVSELMVHGSASP